MIDVVYVHKDKGSGEIALSIKSLKNLEHRNVYIIGDDPKIKDANYIHVPHAPHRWANKSMHADQMSKYLQACHIEELSDNFVAMNDDFFILEPWQPVNYYYGTLQELITRRGIRDTYRNSLVDTNKHLKLLKLETRNFELHTPFLYNKRALREMLEFLMVTGNHTLQIRSIYGNIYKVEGELHRDVKDPVEYRGMPLLSTSEKAFKQEIGAYIKEQLA